MRDQSLSAEKLLELEKENLSQTCRSTPKRKEKRLRVSKEYIQFQLKSVTASEPNFSKCVCCGGEEEEEEEGRGKRRNLAT